MTRRPETRPRNIDPANKPGPKRKPVPSDKLKLGEFLIATPYRPAPRPFVFLLCGDGRISIAIDGGELVIDAPDCVQVATRPEIAQASAEADERELSTPTIDVAQIHVAPCGRCQRLVVDTNQMDLCRGDIETAIAEYVGRRQERTRLERDSDTAENA